MKSLRLNNEYIITLTQNMHKAVCNLFYKEFILCYICEFFRLQLILPFVSESSIVNDTYFPQECR